MGLATSLPNTPTRLRGLAMLSMTSTCEVGTLTATSDSGGGASMSWAYAAGIPCRIDPASAGEQVVGDRLTSRATHIVTLPAGTTVTGDNRLRIDGTVYEVTAVREQTGHAARFVEVVPT